MGDLFRPKITVPGPSAAETNAANAADQERLQAIRDQAERRTSQLMRLFGSRSSFSSGGGGF